MPAVTIDQVQMDRLRDYLEQDRIMHMRSGGKWQLDAGKLQTALESVDILVHREPPPSPPPAPKRKLLITVDADLMVKGDTDLTDAYCSVIIDVFDGTGDLIGTIRDTKYENIRFGTGNG